MARELAQHIRELESLQSRVTSCLDSFHAFVNDLHPELPKATLLDKYNVLSYKLENLAKEVQAPIWKSSLVQPWASAHPSYYPILMQVLLKTEMTPEWETAWSGALAHQGEESSKEDVAFRIEAHDLKVDEHLAAWHELRETYQLKSRVDEHADELPLQGDDSMLGEDVFGDDADLQAINMDDLDDDDDQAEKEAKDTLSSVNVPDQRMQRAGTETETEDEFVHV